MIRPPTNKWWENASRLKIESYQSRKLRFLLQQRVIPFVPFYAGIQEQLSKVKTVNDLQNVPFTSKRDLSDPKQMMMVPEQGILKKQASTLRLALTRGPRGAHEFLNEEFRPVLMTSTTGRSSEPVPFLYTKKDLANLEAGGKRMMEICQTLPDDRVVNAFPFAPHLAFWQAHYASLGATRFTISTGGGKVMGTDGNARLIEKVNPDAIISMPTFLYHLLQHATEEEMQWTNLRTLVLGGEKVPLGMRRKLRSLCRSLGSKEVNVISTYGFTEAKIAFTECPVAPEEEPTGFHIYPDLAYIEIVDPETGQRVPDGSPGEIVYTPLETRGSTVIRYRTGDLIEGGITYEPCPACGRTCPRLVGRISRVSDIRRLNISKVKGTLVDFNTLEHVLDDMDELGAWQIELRKHDDDPLEVDEIVIHATPMCDEDRKDLAQKIREQLLHATELSPNKITFHSWDEMREKHGIGRELKEQKIIDNRPPSIT